MGLRCASPSLPPRNPSQRRGQAGQTSVVDVLVAVCVSVYIEQRGEHVEEHWPAHVAFRARVKALSIARMRNVGCD